MRFPIKGALGALVLTGASALSLHAADVFTPGFLKYEYFGAISNAVDSLNTTAVSNLTSNARFIANDPDTVLWMSSLNTRSVLPDDTHELYGARITGFLVPKTTGDYDFFLHSDDASELWLSTDATTNNLQRIAQETDCCDVYQEPGTPNDPDATTSATTSSPVHLVANQKYAIQVLLKEGGGGDYVDVGWREVSDPTPAADLKPISGEFLGVNVPTAGSGSITTQPQSASVRPGGTAFFNVDYTATVPPITGAAIGNMNTNGVAVQWYRDGVAIPGRTGKTLVIPNVSDADNGAKITAVVTILGAPAPLTTSQATLTVNATAATTANPGYLVLEYYGGVTADIDTFLSDPRYLAHNPDSVLFMNSFNSDSVLPDEAHNDYFARVSGFLVPQETADYDFFLRSDDASRLSLSTDENPANLTVIAEEFGCCKAFLEPIDPATMSQNSQTTVTPIHLVAGQRYAVEALLKEGGGDDYVQVAWRKTGDTTPAASLKPLSAEFLAAPTPVGGAVTITKQPQSITVAENAPATFSVAYTAVQPPPLIGKVGNMVNPVSVVWLENGTVIGSGTNLTIALAKPSDNNAKITAVIGAGGPGATTAEATLTVISDVTAPTVLSALPNNTFDKITLKFSEPITAATATALANYTVDGGLTITGITQVDPSTVVLSTSAQTPGGQYNLTINNLRDTASGGGNLIAANTKLPIAAYALTTGGLRVDRFFNITGADIGSLTADARFPDSPDDTVYWGNFGPFSAGNNYGENYGARITGWLIPGETGDYDFFLHSDDASQLSLSTDATPENLTVVAQETDCCDIYQEPGTLNDDGATSPTTQTPIHLVQGQRYAIEALLKEGGGDDYLQVAWRKTTDTTPAASLRPIPGQFLQTYLDPTATITITQQPTNTTAAAGGPVTLSVGFTAQNGSLGNYADIQWQKAPAGSSTFTNIPGANSATLTIPFATPSDQGAKYRAVVNVSTFANVTSSEAALTLTSDTNAPVVSTVLTGPGSVTLVFSELLDAASAAAKANYSINGGATISSVEATTTAQGMTQVKLNLTGSVLGQNYALTLNGVKDPSGNAVAGGSINFKSSNAFYDFNSPVTPPGTTIIAVGKILPTGGPDGSGVLELTPGIASQNGSFFVPDLAGGLEVTNFLVNFKLFLGEGSGNPADGFSVSFGSDLTAVNTGEEGAGTGITVSFDTYDNGSAEAPAIGVKVAGAEIATTNVAKATLVNDRWVDVSIRLNGDGTLDVLHDGTAYFTNLDVASWGYTPITGGKFLFGARTGGEFEAARLDNLSIIENGDTELPATIGAFTATTLSNGTVTISWSGAGTLQEAPAVTGPYTPVAGVTGTTYSVNTSGAPMKFYRLSQ